ncbi:MAG TPA: hypothetical protein VKY85_24050 [Candidatus Angelobacter sp.]|nr:hypothetical protein [Candidatus Angelobacter sp.]
MARQILVFLLIGTCLGIAQKTPDEDNGLICSVMHMNTCLKDHVQEPALTWSRPLKIQSRDAVWLSSRFAQAATPKPQAKGAPSASTSADPPKDDSEGKQSKRILWIIPNYRAVSADAKLPPLTFKSKFWLATQDSFDYSSFALAGIVAGIGQLRNSTPEFHQGAAGFGRYYWHSFVDQAVGNYLTEAIVPAATREDPRYYTLGHGGFLRRVGYSISRLLITRTDAGGTSFNLSEIVGNGAGAGISNFYYPSPERTWTKTGQKWATQVAIDGVFNVCKEFWPDINRVVFRGHY